MRRQESLARKNWRSALRTYGFGRAAAAAAVRWQESTCYSFTAAEIDTIEAVADQVYGLIHDAVRHTIESHLLPLLGYKPAVVDAISGDWQRYWNRGRPDHRLDGLFTRLDFAYDGGESLRLIGCSADCPDGLFEAAIVQWNWLEALHPDDDQFNGLHEALVERFQGMAVGLRGRDRLHLTCATPDRPREAELAYLAALAEEAGIAPTVIPIQEIGWDGQRFLDLENQEIRWLLKSYPWEALLEDPFGAHVTAAPTTVMDPLWRMPMSNHGLLATLWELYPEHPHLTPASFSEADLPRSRPVLTRSLFGLDHAAQRLVEDGETVAETAPAANPGGTVHLSLPPLWLAGGSYAVLGCWMVGAKCLGMTVQESPSPLGGTEAAVVPHYFR